MSENNETNKVDVTQPINLEGDSNGGINIEKNDSEVNSQEHPKTDKKEKRKLTKKQKIKIAVISLVTVILVGIACLVGGYMYIRGRIYDDKKLPTQSSKYKEVEGITNVLLIGTDGRTLDEPARSDSIIIATLDSNNKVIKLSSIMRDTLVNIPGYGENKINAAYAFGEIDGIGGPNLLMQTISENFEINLDKYVVVNFWGFEAIIDQLGGLEVDVKDYEIEEINKYIGESTGVKSAPLTKPGIQNLNGQQALSYARIRKVGNGGYERDERQRTVLTKAAEKTLNLSITKIPGVANEMLKHVKTNIDPLTLMNYAFTVSKFPEFKTETLQVPVTELSEGRLYKDRGWVLLIDTKQNGKILRDFIYENKVPDVEKLDYASLETVLNNYVAEEARYNSLYGINPADYNKPEGDDTLPVIPPKEEVPKQPVTPTPEEKPVIPSKPDPKPDSKPDQKPNPNPDEDKEENQKPDVPPTTH